MKICFLVMPNLNIRKEQSKRQKRKRMRDKRGLRGVGRGVGEEKEWPRAQGLNFGFIL